LQAYRGVAGGCAERAGGEVLRRRDGGVIGGSSAGVEDAEPEDGGQCRRAEHGDEPDGDPRR
jgi:hypothetical protein